MIKVCRGVLLAGALAMCAVLVVDGRVAAQGAAVGAQAEPVKITTVDGVELHGTFYKSAKTKAPTVIMLHALGDGAVASKAYRNLAETLQPKYSVLLFDFRGHGKSKEVDPTVFWKYATYNNPRTIKGGSPKKATIEYNDFDKAMYTPVLVNDIAAVKAYLDRRNDAGDCNTANTIIIGAESGAMLGAIWLNSQWSLTRMVPNPNNPLLPQQPAANPEGKDVIACIWLSITPKHGTFALSLTRTLDRPVKGNATPTVFMYADKDDVGGKIAKDLEAKLRVKDDKKHDFIRSYAIEGNTKLRGIALIQKSLKTDLAVVDYLDAVMEKKENEWGKHDFKTSQYRWLVGNPPLPGPFAKQLAPNTDANNLAFDGYERFFSR
jgi:hypothetical protein